MKKIILIGIVLVFIIALLPAIANAATINAASCSYSDVSNAIASTSPGDTINVPAGSCTWSSTLSLTRGVIIRGAGVSSTTISSGATILFKIEPSSTAKANNERFEISHMTLNGNRGVGSRSGTIYLNNDASAAEAKNVVIHDMTIADGGISQYGAIWGVVYNVDFIGPVVMVVYTDGAGCSLWNDFSSRRPGTYQNLYFEDCTFNHAEMWYGQPGGPGFVSRYNTFRQLDQDTNLFDSHGPQPNVDPGVQLTELYGNDIDNTNGGTTIIWDHRGGETAFFWNRIVGPGSSNWRIRTFGCDSAIPCSPPVISQPRGHYWNNRDNDYVISNRDVVISTCPSEAIAWNDEVWKDEGGSCSGYSCTSGIGCGTLANRPTQCSVGTAYWATNQDCSQVSADNVGANPTTPISGTLYKCTAPNTWVEYYTPYTYPHPLRNGGPGPECTTHHHSSCYNGDVYWYDSCNVREGIREDCGTQQCVNEQCTTQCTSHDHFTCYNGDVYWYDSCNVREGVREECGTNQCVGGQCVTTTTGNSYWVSSNGQSSWSNCRSTNPLSGSSACSLSTANSNARAGDTIYLRGGTYSVYINPQNSGTASQRIIFQNYGSEAVTIQDASYGIRLNGNDYITVEGINFYNLDNFMWLQNNANHNIIAYCNFDHMRNYGAWSGSKIYRSSSYNWVHHCQFSEYGHYDGYHSGTVLDIGDEYSDTDFSNYNLLEDNIFFDGSHHILGVFGLYTVVRNNYFYGTGARLVIVNGYEVNSGWNLFEGNRFGYAIDTDPTSPGAAGLHITNNYNIVRRNLFYYNNLAGIQMSVTSNYISDIVYNKVYNNAFLHNGWNEGGSFCPDAACSAVCFAHYSGPWVIENNALKNNIYHGHPTSNWVIDAHGYYRVEPNDQIFANNWNGDELGDPRFVDASSALGDPMDSSYPDLRLQSNSPCIDAGGYLTTITSSSGSGTSFTVDDAGYFMDGWGIVQGDDIQIVGTSQRAIITDIDYDTDRITVDRSLTWTQGQGVSLSYEGSAPDAGAFEYGGTTPTCSNCKTNQCSFYDNCAISSGTCSSGYCCSGACTEPQPECSDGTAYGQCSSTKPKYCDNGNLVDRCSVCGCSSGECQADGSCKTQVTGLSFEAEDGAISSPFSVSNGYVYQTIQTEPSSGGKASYVFNIENAGDYIIRGGVNAPNDVSNSFFINIDSEPTDPYMIWDVDLTNGFEERTVSWRGGGTAENDEFDPKIFSLTAGEHELIIRGREADTLLDSITIEVYGTTSIAGDVDNDGDVDIFDLIFVAVNFGKSDFDPRADTNNDNVVDIFDIVYVASRFT